MKTTGPVILGFVVGLIMFLQYFIPKPFMLTAYNLVLDWKQVVIGMTYILGVWSLMRYHTGRIQRRVDGWTYSIVALAGFSVMVLSALVFGTEHGPFPWMFENVQAQMQSTMFALLAFYVASASYRAFRARTVEATLLLVAGVIVMLGRVPLGDAIRVRAGDGEISLAAVATFIMDVPNLATKTGILIGIGLGVTATALKILLGIERTYLGRGSR